MWGTCLISVFVACAAPPTEDVGAAGSRTRYSPDEDPLVNPPELFEPLDGRTHLSDEDGTVYRHTLDRPTSMNPTFVTTTSDQLLAELMYDGLVFQSRDVEALPDPASVESMEFSDDRRVTSIRLRADKRWHDAKPWTAHDVRFSWQVAIDPRAPSFYYRGFAEQIEDVKVIDDLNLKVVHRESTPIATEHLRFPIIPRHIWGERKERAADPTMKSSPYFTHWGREEVVASGPYRFVDWVPGDRVVLERWDDYAGERPNFARVVFKIQPDRNTALLLFRKGELDDIWLTVQQFAKATTDEAFADIGVKAWAPRRMLGYLAWNQRGTNPFFGDVRVRRAMGHAYDRARVIETVTHNVYLPSTGLFEPGHWCFNPEVSPIPYHLEEASRLLDEADWRIDSDDGWRYKEIDGERVRFDFEMLIYQTFNDAVRMSDILRDSLRRIGVTFRSSTLEGATLVDRMRRGEFEAIAGTATAYGDVSIWRDFLHTDMIDGGLNYWGYRNPEVDRLFDEGRRELDRDRRAELYRQIQGLVYEDQPLLFLWNYTVTQGFARDMRGVVLSPIGVRRFRPGPRAWWRLHAQ
ncbi:MAG: ABC transporter substrate-binding protein [Acidobacteriota bacterium]|nr:ABC transporter substrate-binding protein [Acidobacteriota bacterium]